jgi:hypothetical protein
MRTQFRAVLTRASVFRPKSFLPFSGAVTAHLGEEAGQDNRGQKMADPKGDPHSGSFDRFGWRCAPSSRVTWANRLVAKRFELGAFEF